MASSLKITVWNAAQHVLKVGHQKLILHPGQSLVVERDGDMTALIESGKLVILDAPEDYPMVSEVPAKKKKKEVVEVPVEEPQDETLNVESAEDSILPEEVE